MRVFFFDKKKPISLCENLLRFKHNDLSQLSVWMNYTLCYSGFPDSSGCWPPPGTPNCSGYFGSSGDWHWHCHSIRWIHDCQMILRIRK